jgi:aldehyde:ferredoxin oxidoreductase
LKVIATSSRGQIYTVETEGYVPKFIGGKGLIHRIAWEEIPRRTGAFDPENRLMIAAGPNFNVISEFTKYFITNN